VVRLRAYSFTAYGRAIAPRRWCGASLQDAGFNGQCFILDALRLVVGSVDLIIKWQGHSATP
jgi:hypothetical protein